MIIGNNNPGNNNFHNQRRPINNNSQGFGENTFNNRWNEVQSQNAKRQEPRNMFVKNIKDQQYSNAANTEQMQDRTLALLQERLTQGTITPEEFSRQCENLANQRQNLNKRNKLF